MIAHIRRQGLPRAASGQPGARHATRRPGGAAGAAPPARLQDALRGRRHLPRCALTTAAEHLLSTCCRPKTKLLTRRGATTRRQWLRWLERHAECLRRQLEPLHGRRRAVGGPGRVWPWQQHSHQLLEPLPRYSPHGHLHSVFV